MYYPGTVALCSIEYGTLEYSLERSTSSTSTILVLVCVSTCTSTRSSST